MEVYLQLLPEEKRVLDKIEKILTQAYNAVVSHIKENELHLSETEINKFLTRYRKENNLQIGSRVLRLVTALVSKRGLFTHKNIPSDWKPTNHFPIVIRYRTDDGIMRNYKLGQDNYGINVQLLNFRNGLIEVKFAKEKQPVPIRLITPAVFYREELFAYEVDYHYGLILKFDYLLKLLLFQAYNFILFKDKAGNWKISIPINTKRMQQLVTHQIEYHLGYLGSIPFRKNYHDYYSYNDTTDFNTRIFKFVKKYAKEIAFARMMTTVQASMGLVSFASMGVKGKLPASKNIHLIPTQLYIPDNSVKYFDFEGVKEDTILFNVRVMPSKWFKEKGLYSVLLKALSLFHKAKYNVFSKALKYDENGYLIITPDLFDYFSITPKVTLKEYRRFFPGTPAKLFADDLKVFKNKSYYAETLIPIIISTNYKDYFFRINLNNYDPSTLQPIQNQSEVFNIELYKELLKISVIEISPLKHPGILSNAYKLESKLRRRTYMRGRIIQDEQEVEYVIPDPMTNIGRHILYFYEKDPIRIPMFSFEDEDKHKEEIKQLEVNSIYFYDRNNNLNKFWFKHKFHKQFTQIISMAYDINLRSGREYFCGIFYDYFFTVGTKVMVDGKEEIKYEIVFKEEYPIRNINEGLIFEKRDLRELSPMLETGLIVIDVTSSKAYYHIFDLLPIYYREVAKRNILDDRNARLELVKEIGLDLNELAKNHIKSGVWDLFNDRQRKLYYNAEKLPYKNVYSLGVPNLIVREQKGDSYRAIESIIKFKLKEEKIKDYDKGANIARDLVREYFSVPEGGITEEGLMVQDNVLLWLEDTIYA